MIKWKLLAALPLLAGALWAAPSDANDLVLPEKIFPGLDVILKSAVNQSPRMVDKNIDLEIAENDRIAARAALLPTVSGYYRDYESRDRRADLEAAGEGPVNVQKVYYDASINQPLFYWGEKKNTARMGAIRQRIAQGQYQEAYRLLAQDLRARYLALISVKIVAARARFNQKFTHDQLQLAEDRLKNRVISENDIFPTRLNAERADIEVERVAFEFENSLQALARLSGTQPLTEDAVPDTMPPVAYLSDTIGQLLNAYTSQKDLPSVEAATLREQIAVQNLDFGIQKYRLYPKFSLAAGVSQDEQAYALGQPKYQVNSVYAGFSVSWAIFDGFASRSAQRSSLARKRQLENDYEETTVRLVEQAKSESRQIYFAARTMSIDDRFLTSSEGYVKTRQDEFSRGVISEADVSLAQLALFDSRIVSYRSRADFLTKIGDFLGTVNADPVVANAPIR
ncbi:MAG TPA: TolC family protein [Candidatus Didemnitutus sp.]|nr:TolC family protein [Candidatus Didemnitutus sp.]